MYPSLPKSSLHGAQKGPQIAIPTAWISEMGAPKS